MNEKLEQAKEVIKQTAQAFKDSGLPLETAGTTINTILMNILKNGETRVESKSPIKETQKLCDHGMFDPISGENKYGPWRGQKCLECGMVRFESKTKDGRPFWKDWEVSKKK